MNHESLTQRQRIHPVILCGGSGTRLWPLSRVDLPKEFLALKGEKSLIEETLVRADRLEGATKPILVTGARHERLVRHALNATQTEAIVILEPQARNTAPAVAAAALVAAARDPEAILLVLPADHLIADDDAFRHSVEEAVELAGHDWLTVLGIEPHEPSSAFGYILRGDSLLGQGSRVARFIEKPVRQEAAKLIAEGALWNAGMVAAKAGLVIEALRQHEPAVVEAVHASIECGDRRDDTLQLAASRFAAATKISFDHAVLERHDRVAVVPLRAGWRDLGTWSEVAELYPADAQGNRGKGEARFTASTGNFIFSSDRTVLALGIEDLIIVDSADALLVAKREHLPLLGDAVKQLPEERADSEAPCFAWGECETVAEDTHCQVRRLSIAPGQATTALDHGLDAGHWIVVTGSGTATIGGRMIPLREGQSTVTPAHVMRHFQNSGDEALVLIEVRLGRQLTPARLDDGQD